MYIETSDFMSTGKDKRVGKKLWRIKQMVALGSKARPDSLLT